MSVMDGIKKIERQTMGGLVYSDVCDLLMAGEAAPGGSAAFNAASAWSTP